MNIAALQSWFRASAREMPWRLNPSPYAVWVSEVMLQQTQVSVVIPYFESWMREFPTIDRLAEAPIERVIKQWEGLGYYARARNLHRGAQFVVKHYQGNLPMGEDELSAIPGIGPYTVGAIRSFAFRQKAVALDGNVERVISRLYALREDVKKVSVRKKLTSLVAALLDEKKPWQTMEALIELGALCCKKKPNCASCPLQKSCLAYQMNIANTLPYKPQRAKTTFISRHVEVFLHDGYVLVRKGKEGAIMADLWQFPYYDSPHEKESIALKQKPMSMAGLKRVKQSYTTFRVELEPTLYEIEKSVNVEGYIWKPISELLELPFCSGHRRVARQVVEKYGMS